MQLQVLCWLENVTNWRNNSRTYPNNTLPLGWVQSTPVLKPQYGPNAQNIPQQFSH